MAADGKYELEETKFGFTWGPITVERVVSDPATFGAVITIITNKETLEIRSTPSGLIRIGDINKKL